jgi:hypothetical protein
MAATIPSPPPLQIGDLLVVEHLNSVKPPDLSPVWDRYGRYVFAAGIRFHIADDWIPAAGAWRAPTHMVSLRPASPEEAAGWLSDQQAQARRPADPGAGFEGWWSGTGSGLAPAPGEEPAAHAERVARAAWAAALQQAALPSPSP